MPKSKLRGGAKSHRTKVTHRNNTLKGLRKKAQKEFNEMFEKQMEELKAQYKNENGETMDLNAEVFSDLNNVTVNDVEVVTPEVTE
jgi:hypothetical protein